ncbi:MAG: hypothetical protein OIF38_18650, partial [Cellvibrionaceae bacterium]|nr:hypothetical protein [Cellvibrionaceae bacterium]
MGAALIIFIVFILYGAWQGYRKGLEKTAIRLLAFIGAYGLAIAYFMPLSQWLKQQWDKPWLLIYLVTGALLLFVGATLISLLLKGLLGLVKMLGSDGATTQVAADNARHRESGKAGAASALAGAGLGAGVGTVLAIIVVWGLDIAGASIPALKGQPQQGISGELQSLANKSMASVSGQVLKQVGGTGASAGLASAIIKNPQQNMQRIGRISRNPKLQNLLANNYSKRMIRDGDVRALSTQPNFKELMADSDIQGLAADAGLSVDSVEGQQQVAGAMVDVWSRVEQLRNNPEVRDLLSDPELLEQVQRGNYLALLNNPKFDRLFTVFRQAGGGATAGARAPTQTAAPRPNELAKK